jgi:hypothetical protein
MRDAQRLSRLRDWMARIESEMLALVTDDHTYWRLQKDVIQRNHRLLTMRSAYFDMLNYAYVSTTASAVRRLVEKQNKSKTIISLRVLLEEIKQHPTILKKPVPIEQLHQDLAALKDIEGRVKPYVDRLVAHHDRRGLARIPKLGDLKDSVSALGETFRRYCGLVEGTDLELKVSYLQDFEIFTFPWIVDSPKSLVDT